MTLDRILTVCKHSGHRGKGIYNCLIENRKILHALKTVNPPPFDLLKQYPQIEDWIEANEVFFTDLLNVLECSPEWFERSYDQERQANSFWLGKDYTEHLVT